MNKCIKRETQLLQNVQRRESFYNFPFSKRELGQNRYGVYIIICHTKISLKKSKRSQTQNQQKNLDPNKKLFNTHVKSSMYQKKFQYPEKVTGIIYVSRPI